MNCVPMMKRLLCCLAALMLLMPSALADTSVVFVAREYNAEVSVDGKPIEDAAALRDGSDDTAYSSRKGNKLTLTLQAGEGEMIAQAYLRMDRLPQRLELQTSLDGRKWQGAGAVDNPGAELVLTPAVPAENLRLVITFPQATVVNVTELRAFGPGALPETLHAWRGEDAADVLLLADDLAQADAGRIAQWAAEGRSVAVGCLSAGGGGSAGAAGRAVGRGRAHCAHAGRFPRHGGRRCCPREGLG